MVCARGVLEEDFFVIIRLLLSLILVAGSGVSIVGTNKLSKEFATTFNVAARLS